MSSNGNFISPSTVLNDAFEAMANASDWMLGDNYDGDSASSTTAATSSVPYIIVGVIIGVSGIFVAYMLVTKLMCKDTATGVPISAFTSKFQGKLKSSSSIKTVKTNEVQSVAAYPVPTAKPVASSGASAAKKAPSKAAKLPSKAASKAASKVGGARKGSRI
ncbi:hypothetical protein TYRP_007441 [Tyrophagus putrescentiae]|nr:hypothetical protein TYRP_007441 [Tyrophagus putrescentiae]